MGRLIELAVNDVVPQQFERNKFAVKIFVYDLITFKFLIDQMPTIFI